MTENKLRIDDSLSVRNGHLYVEECDTCDLAATFGTPLFVISEDQIRRNYRRIYRAFADRWPEGEVNVLPALKAAPYIAVRRILSEEGAGCDTFGPSELECAVRGNARPDLISVNGSLKSAETIRRGVDLGARIVIDAPRELEIVIDAARTLDKKARVMFRLKPYLADLDIESDFHMGLIKDATQRIRYGMPTNEVLELGPKVSAAAEYIEVIGFHCHIGRHSTLSEVWKSLVANCVKLAAELCDQWGWRDWTPIFDFGGGFAPPRNFDTDHARTGEPAPPIEDYAEAMTTTFRTALLEHGFNPNGVGLEIEPGRGLHSDTGLHLTTVINMKHADLIQQTWAETDTSEVFVGTWAMDPSVAPFNFKIASQAAAEATTSLDIVGKSCGGELILLDAATPRLAAGDVIAFLDTGAYIETLGCNFNAMPRPGVLLVSGGNADWIRRPETIEDVFAREQLPDWLDKHQPDAQPARAS